MTGPFERDAPSRGGAPSELWRRRLHPRTLAAAWSMTVLVVAGLQTPIALSRLPDEYRGQMAVTWLLRLGCACEIAGWLPLLAIAIWMRFTARGRRYSGVRVATAAIVGGAMVIVGELLQAAVWNYLMRGMAPPWTLVRTLEIFGIVADHACAAIACTALAVAWRCSMRRRRK